MCACAPNRPTLVSYYVDGTIHPKENNPLFCTEYETVMEAPPFPTSPTFSRPHNPLSSRRVSYFNPNVASCSTSWMLYSQPAPISTQPSLILPCSNGTLRKDINLHYLSHHRQHHHHQNAVDSFSKTDEPNLLP